VIVAKDITLSYDNKINIIEKGSFHIKKSEFVFISGSSGSGKSTLLNSIYGELKLKSGNLVVNNHDLSSHDYNKILTLRKKLGIVFQDFKLIKEYTIEENILVPLQINEYSEEISNTQVKNLLQHVKLSNRAGSYPNQLSGGEQQRVALARALGHNPDIILADEPTGNLDDYSSDIVWNLLKDANEQLGVTIVAVTHRMPTNLSIDYRQYNIDNGVIYEAS
jgi:cell division transport system ATP-binding protein